MYKNRCKGGGGGILLLGKFGDVTNLEKFEGSTIERAGISLTFKDVSRDNFPCSDWHNLICQKLWKIKKRGNIFFPPIPSHVREWT